LDSELIRVTEKFNEEGREGLTPYAQSRVRISALVNWGIYESAYYANERGVLGEREWIRFDRVICRIFRRRVQGDQQDDLWEPEGFTPMTELLTPDFVDYIKSSCE
jgi:hypothetical protein